MPPPLLDNVVHAGGADDDTDESVAAVAGDGEAAETGSSEVAVAEVCCAVCRVSENAPAPE